MSKDTPATPASPQLLAHPGTNIPFGMGYPYPVIHPPMGQFLPLGMVPLDGNTIQHYMELATKSGFHPAMIAPVFGPSTSITPPNMLLNQNGDKLRDDSGTSLPDQTQTLDHASGTLISGHDITRTTRSLNIHSIGSDKSPVMPMPPMFFLPFGPVGVAGHFPSYPTFNVITAPTKYNEVPQEDSKPEQNLLDEQHVLLPRKSEEEKNSDELDVARILVDMQVPVLNQVQSSVATSGCNQDSNKPSSQDVTRSPSPPVDVHPRTSCHSGFCEPTRLDNTPSSFQHCSEQLQNDKQLEEAHSNDFIINKVDEETSEDVILKDSSDPNDEVRPKELQLESIGFEDPSGVKLEVEDEGESSQPAQSMDITGLKHPSMPGSKDVQIVDIPYDLLEETWRPGEMDQHLLELKSIKSEVMDVSSGQNPTLESTVVLEEGSKLLTSDSIKVSSEQINVDSVDRNALKQESLEERKDQDNSEKDVNCEVTSEPEPDANQNGVLKKDYKCDVCSQLFRSPLGLQKHIEFHMDDGKHYTCSMCFKHFCNDNALQEHHEKHMRKRPHKCEVCPKAFRDPGSLQKHVRVHTGEKPYKCKDCPRSFAEYSSLRKHQRVHTGEQPYKCQYCSKAFSISGNLQRHILIHTGERPYKCNFCTKAFNNPSHLRRHVKNLHFRGDAAIDEAMLSHYGNPAATKTAENELPAEIKEEQETQHVNSV